MPAQAAGPLSLLTQRQVLECVDHSANNAAPVDVRRVAVCASPVLCAATEEVGVPGTHQAV